MNFIKSFKCFLNFVFMFFRKWTVRKLAKFMIYFAMQRSMGLICKKNEVFNSIIIPFAVNMVDNLSFLKIAIQMFFHYKAMLKKIAVIIMKRMSWLPNIHITMRRFITSTFPCWIFGAVVFVNSRLAHFKNRFKGVLFTEHRMGMSCPMFFELFSMKHRELFPLFGKTHFFPGFKRMMLAKHGGMFFQVFQELGRSFEMTFWHNKHYMIGTNTCQVQR